MKRDVNGVWSAVAAATAFEGGGSALATATITAERWSAKAVLADSVPTGLECGGRSHRF